MPKKILAQCHATAGYGTDWYDPETCDCHHSCYAGVDKVVVNAEYWKQYDSCMSEALNNDFSLGFNFDKYELTVFTDGSKVAKVIA